VQQAALLGEHIRSRYEPVKVWSSDLQRCAQTADATGLSFERTKSLREIKFGDWEGMYWTDIFAESSGVASKFVTGDPSFQAPGGESISSLVKRAGRFIEEAELLSGDGDVLVVSHGGMLRSLIVALLGLPEDSTARFYCANCAVSTVTAANGLVRLETLNETAHLDAAALSPVVFTPGRTRSGSPGR